MSQKLRGDEDCKHVHICLKNYTKLNQKQTKNVENTFLEACLIMIFSVLLLLCNCQV